MSSDQQTPVAPSIERPSRQNDGARGGSHRARSGDGHGCEAAHIDLRGPSRNRCAAGQHGAGQVQPGVAVDGQARGVLRQTLPHRKVEPLRGRGEELVRAVNVILGPGSHHLAGQHLETGLHGMDRGRRVQSVAGPSAGQVGTFLQTDQLRGEEIVAAQRRGRGGDNRATAGQLAFLGNNEKRARQKRIAPGKKRVVTGGQAGDSVEVDLLSGPQPCGEIARVAAERARVDAGIETAERRHAIPEARQDGKGLRHLDPEKPLLRLGGDGVGGGVNVNARRPSAACVRNKVSGIILGTGVPRLVGRAEQIATTPDAGDPAVSQKVPATANIDNRTGRRHHIARGQCNQSLGQSTGGDVHSAGIDPRQAVGCQSEGDGQACGGNRGGGRSTQDQICRCWQRRGGSGHRIGGSGA